MVFLFKTTSDSFVWKPLTEIRMKISPAVLLCRTLFYLALVSLTLQGCSRKHTAEGSGNSGDYYFRATLGGSKKDFHLLKFQGGDADGPWQHIVVGGAEVFTAGTNGDTGRNLNFEIFRTGGNITPGSYSTLEEKQMIARYAIQKSGGTVLYNTVNGPDNFILKIDAISGDGIRGTFSGTLRNDAGVAISVTDGSFNLPYDQMVNP